MVYMKKLLTVLVLTFIVMFTVAPAAYMQDEELATEEDVVTEEEETTGEEGGEPTGEEPSLIQTLDGEEEVTGEDEPSLIATEDEGESEAGTSEWVKYLGLGALGVVAVILIISLFLGGEGEESKQE